MPAQSAPQHGQGRRRRAHHRDPFALAQLPQPPGHVPQPVRRPALLHRPAQADQAQLHERRVLALAPQLDFLGEEPLVVRREHQAPERVVRIAGLDDHLPRTLPPAGPARSLHQKLEGPLCSAVVRQVAAQVRVGRYDQRDLGEMVPFGQHLGAHQHLRPAGPERLQDGLQALGPAGGVPVHAQNPRPSRQFRVQNLLDALRALAHGQVVRGAA